MLWFQGPIPCCGFRAQYHVVVSGPYIILWFQGPILHGHVSKMSDVVGGID